MKISVIIPAWNESKMIHAALEDLFMRHQPEEVIVVDGGSADQTVKIASEWTRVIQSPKGRAKQFNYGAREAGGDVFLFLHADTRLPKDGLQKIKDSVSHGARAGRFRMQLDDSRWILRFYSSYTRFQLFSYGDQGFFIHREVFEKMGGFREDVPFEDIDFYRRLLKITRPVILKDSIIASARKFSEVGYLRQKFVNLFLVALYYVGFDVFRLKKKVYPDIR